MLTLLLASLASSPSTLGANEIRYEPYAVERDGGRILQGRIGRLAVPEDRARPEGPKIELAFARFSTTSPSPSAPIVYLVGGPGPSGIEHGVERADGRLFRLLDHADVILLDQRGTGRSRPNLEEGPSFEYELPLDRPATRADYVAAWTAAARRCAAYWSERGVDLGAFDTRASAADVEDLRRALQLDRIQLWGESYGTHLGLAVLRAHPEHVERAVFLRVEGPDDTLKLPSTIQRHFEELGRLAAADPGAAELMPDLVKTVGELLGRMAAEPVAADALLDGKKARVVMGPWDLQHWLASRLGFAYEFRDVPRHVSSFAQGDWTLLAAHAVKERRGTIGSAMALAMDCASSASAARRERIAREAADPRNLLGDAANAPYPEVCAAFGEVALEAAFRAPFRCDVPVLFVSGALDARTPPENVAILAPHFTKHAHVLVTSAGHETIEFLDESFRGLVADFLQGRHVTSRTIELPPARFRASKRR